MNNILYKLYFKSSKKSFLGIDDFWGRFWSFSTRRIIPHYFLFTIPFQNSGVRDSNSDEEIIVSLTSHPGRIKFVWIAIESMLRQTHKPNRIILWLGKEKFSGLEELPDVLKKQIKRGLTIEFREDLKPHTKYYYAIKENPESVVITVDDDIIYPPNLISTLLKHSKENPDVVICHGARLIKYEVNNFGIYEDWMGWDRIMIESFSRQDILPLGVMGVLYPPHIFNELLFDTKLIRKFCYTADDLWLKANSILSEVKSLCTNEFLRPFVDISHVQNSGLKHINNGENNNQIQWDMMNERFNLIEIFIKQI